MHAYFIDLHKQLWISSVMRKKNECLNRKLQQNHACICLWIEFWLGLNRNGANTRKSGLLDSKLMDKSRDFLAMFSPLLLFIDYPLRVRNWSKRGKTKYESRHRSSYVSLNDKRTLRDQEITRSRSHLDRSQALVVANGLSLWGSEKKSYLTIDGYTNKSARKPSSWRWNLFILIEKMETVTDK